MRNCIHHGIQSTNNYYKTVVKEPKSFRIQYRCILCKKVYDSSKPKSKESPEKKARRKAAVKARRKALRLEVLQAYSPNVTCENCKESHVEFLSIDHINGGGRPHVVSVGNLYAWLKRSGWPEGFRVLCYNCNFKIGIKLQPSRLKKSSYECSSSYLKARRRFERNPEKEKLSKAKRREYTQKNKLMIFTHYGAKCQCCNATDIDILSLDHTEGQGNAHRRDVGTRGSGFYRWVVKNEFPKILRILCLNCNKARGAYGICPHELSISFKE